MTATLTSEAIIFAIHSAIKLGGTFQKAYADSLKSKSIILPLPEVDNQPNQSTIEDFFNKKENKSLFIDQIQNLNKLHEKATDENLDDDDLETYRDFYFHCYNSLNGTKDLNPSELTSLLRIRQWEVGNEPVTKPLQLVAGTLVEVGIDYFSQVPGAINTDSSYGKFLKSFLTGIDDIPFAEGESINRIVKRVVPKLFVSAAETMEQISTEITGDEKLQQFIKATSSGITKDLYDRIEVMGTADDDTEVIQWGQLMFRSLVKGINQKFAIYDQKIL